MNVPEKTEDEYSSLDAVIVNSNSTSIGNPTTSVKPRICRSTKFFVGFVMENPPLTHIVLTGKHGGCVTRCICNLSSATISFQLKRSDSKELKEAVFFTAGVSLWHSDLETGNFVPEGFESVHPGKGLT